MKTAGQDEEDDRDEVTDIVLRPRAATDDMDVDARRIQGSLRSRLFGVRSEPIRIGRFRLGRILGTGGMGVVHEAHDEKLDRKVALKLLHDDREADEQPRLLREAQALGRLSHPNVVQVYEVGTFEGRVWIAMEFLDGPSVAAWLADERRPWRQILDKFIQAGEGLAAAHAEGLVHRDLKPANLLLGGDGRVRVVDFGLARQLERIDVEESTQPNPVIALVTHTSLAGTPAYMSPEQVNRAGVDARSDQYSFCVALYEALFGERPYQANTPTAILQEIADGRVQPPARPLSAHVPLHVLRAVMKGLSMAPDDRFDDMPALLAELRRDPWTRRWQVLAFGAVTVLGVGAMWPRAEVEPCADVPKDDSDVWPQQARDDVEGAYRGSGFERWQLAFERLDASLTEWADDWSRQRHDVCVEHHVERALSAELHDRRAYCLERVRREVDALVSTLANVDAAAVQTMRLTAAALPDLAQCDGQRVLSRRATPNDPRFAEVEDLISKGSAEALVGHTSQALDAADAALALATELGDPLSLAESEALRGGVLRKAGRFEEAIAEYTSAAGHAEVAADDAHRFEALLGLIDVTLIDQRLDRARLMLDLAASLAERIEAGPAGTARLLAFESRWHSSNKDYDQAIELGERALEPMLLAFGPESSETLELQLHIANFKLRSGRGEEALTMYLAVRDAYLSILGPNEPSLAKYQYQVAYVLWYLKRPHEAFAPLQRAIELREPYALAGDVHLVDCYRMYSILLSSTGDVDAAYALLLKARELAKGVPPDDYRQSQLIAQISELDYLIGRHQAVIDLALPWLRSKRAKGEFTANMALMQYRLIECLEAVGDDRQALELMLDFLEAFETVTDEKFLSDYQPEIDDVRERLRDRTDSRTPPTP